MKKLINSIIALLCVVSFSETAGANNTDISTIDNVIYMNPVSVAVGSQAVLSVKMKNTVEVQGFQFDLYLPEGVEFVKDEDEFPLVELSTERTTAKKTNSFDCTIQENGSLRVYGTSTNGSTIAGNDGEIVQVTIFVSVDVTPADYALLLKEVTVTDCNSVGYDTEVVETTITIGAPADKRTVLDETSTAMPEAATGVDVRVKRTIKAGEWSTICLPFAMSAAQVKEAFGEDVQLADFKGVETDTDEEENVVGLTVNFSEANAIEANHPYVIKVSEAVSEFTVDGVDIDPEDEPSVDKDEYTVGKGKTATTYYNRLVGTYVANTTLKATNLFLNDNKFYYSAGKTKMKGYRAYFDFYDVLTDVEDAYFANIRFSFVEEATGIGERAADTRERAGVYPLQGVSLGTKDVRSLPKGIYIVNGKKYVSK